MFDWNDFFEVDQGCSFSEVWLGRQLLFITGLECLPCSEAPLLGHFRRRGRSRSIELNFSFASTRGKKSEAHYRQKLVA
jgi:hypothetical protein